MSTAKTDPCLATLCGIVRKGCGLSSAEARLMLVEVDRLRAELAAKADDLRETRSRYFGENTKLKAENVMLRDELYGISGAIDSLPVDDPRAQDVRHWARQIRAVLLSIATASKADPPHPLTPHGETQRVIRETVEPMIEAGLRSLSLHVEQLGGNLMLCIQRPEFDDGVTGHPAYAEPMISVRAIDIVRAALVQP